MFMVSTYSCWISLFPDSILPSVFAFLLGLPFFRAFLFVHFQATPPTITFQNSFRFFLSETPFLYCFLNAWNIKDLKLFIDLLDLKWFSLNGLRGGHKGLGSVFVLYR